MSEIATRFLSKPSGRTMQIIALLFASAAVSAQVADFQIVWTNIGEVAAMGHDERARAGRQLFMAPDLVGFSLNKVTIEKVEVQPSTIPLKIGQRFCLTSLRVQANSENRSSVDDAPLSVAVRQDHRERLGMQREKQDICFRPSEDGEYPVRLNSLLPARDGTTRGAQIFLRVATDTTTSGPAAASSD